MLTHRSACTPSSHERLKRDSQFPKLPLVGVWKLPDLELELRNCEACHSTIAKPVQR